MSIEYAEPAFPTHPSLAHPNGIWGMTLRDYFAAKAMQGTLVVAIAGAIGEPAKNTIKVVAEGAYAVADAMLKARQA